MKRKWYERLFGIGCLMGALALLSVGALRVHKVYDAETGKFGLVTFHTIGEHQLVVDATFGGVVRRGIRLCSTYDRSRPRGKRTCPT